MDTLALNPYAGVDWDAVDGHKAQFHTHTSHPPTEGHSGLDDPEIVVDDYHDAGYSVLALTGHEYNIEETTWPWTDWERDPAELGMVGIEAAELGGGDEGIDHEILSLFSDLADTVGLTVHEVLDRINEAGGLAVFPHPGRYDEDIEWYFEQFDAHPCLLGVEVVNAADRYPTNRDIWDRLQGELGARRAVWGFANDDYHGREAGYSFDRSRNVLFLEELTETAVREALTAGQFCYQYVVEDDPPVVEAVRHDPDRGTLVVAAENAATVQWASGGEVVARGARLDYRENDDVTNFARARLLSGSGSETGTQPFLFE